MDESRGAKKKVSENRKQEQLAKYRVNNLGKKLTTEKSVKISNNEYTLKAGKRGPILMEDIHFIEKQMHFNHERIPERVVQARGFGAHGKFELYKSMKKYTKALFLGEPGSKTPVFVRFSNMAGNKGSSDTTLGPRGFSTKFYTADGNYDLLAISIPVFILNDAYKFTDAIHALNPEPQNDIPQASSAHDNFWDFVANNVESAHFVMWAMSDRTAPRSWRMMEGFSVNTFRFINEIGKATFVRFHWKPVLGVHSLLIDEAQTIAGLDPDFHRKDLWDSIEQGLYPQYELGVQLIDEEEAFTFNFDILDPTKLWPEEIVPVEIIGKMTLTRNVNDFFSEVEQVAFDPANIIPGIDFSNDPVLQGRLFAYKDTQMHRLGSSNYNDLPINSPVCPVHNNYQGGYMRQKINEGNVNYHNNSLANNTPSISSPEEGGSVHDPEKVEGYTVKAVSESFKDYFSQARLFWNSMSSIEKQHITQAFCVQLGNVESKSVKQQVVHMIARVDEGLAHAIADYIGVKKISGVQVSVTESSPSLSIMNTAKFAYSLKVGALIADGFHGEEVQQVASLLRKNDVLIDFIGEKFGTVTGEGGTKLEVSKTFLTTNLNLYDALYVVGGSTENNARLSQDIMSFISEAYKHFKPIGVATTAKNFMKTSTKNNLAGVVFAEDHPNFGEEFIVAIREQRFWERT